MPFSKRIVITISENLLLEVDNMKNLESKNRSELVRDALAYYLSERKKNYFRDKMKQGYVEMAEINLKIACENNDT